MYTEKEKKYTLSVRKEDIRGYNSDKPLQYNQEHIADFLKNDLNMLLEKTGLNITEHDNFIVRVLEQRNTIQILIYICNNNSSNEILKNMQNTIRTNEKINDYIVFNAPKYSDLIIGYKNLKAFSLKEYIQSVKLIEDNKKYYLLMKFTSNEKSVITKFINIMTEFGEKKDKSKKEFNRMFDKELFLGEIDKLTELY